MHHPRLARTSVTTFAVTAAALAGATLVPAQAPAAPARVWAAGNTVFARAAHLPPGIKWCWVRVPPAPYDVIGTYLGSQKGTSVERKSGASTITLRVGGLLPAPYRVYFECRMNGSLNIVARVDRVVTVGF
ncbi:MAG: hypothetical protein QM728_00705 [Gordonia sp. (in: high G+C Gram-positive bacteria)]|uniref:hypothetical protein n=1 Tax=Gordonia sp. (in: high G+C Gram-positive bacteria) TaxID=84139 RepID=UPI0039E582EB